MKVTGRRSPLGEAGAIAPLPRMPERIRRRGAPLRIARARGGQAPELTRVAFAAKAHWGYPRSWLARWSEALTVTPGSIARHPTWVAYAGARVVGFYAMRIAGRTASLEHFWVLPRLMGRGVGRRMFRHFESRARRAGADRADVESDPHAEGFYVRMGAARYARRPARMDRRPRFMPLLTKRLLPTAGPAGGRACTAPAPRSPSGRGTPPRARGRRIAPSRPGRGTSAGSWRGAR